MRYFHVSASVVLLVTLCAGGATAQSSTKEPTESISGYFTEPRHIQKAAEIAEKRTREREYKDGFFLVSGSMITGAGWLSLGPGYRHLVFGKRALFTTSAALSWRLYQTAQASLDTAPSDSPVSFGGGVMYQDALQVNYFGLGNDSLEAARTGFRLRSTDIEGHGSYKRGALTLQARLGWIPDLEVRSMAGRLPDYPDTEDVFTEATAPGLDAQPSYVHSDIGATYDVRNTPGHPTSGGIYTVNFANYHDLDTGRYSFRSLQLEGVHYVPLGSPRWIAAFRAWGVFTGTSDRQTIPFFLMPNVGGRSTIRGFRDFRFYGPQMEVFSAESRWAIWEHLDAAVFVDAGRVADRVSDLGFRDMKHAVGVGVRFHTERSTVARMDIAKSREGWILTFKMNDPFRRKTLAGDLPPTVPFVP